MIQKKIIFLIRAYNDIDIQMPLVASMAKDQNFKVEVWGYPADGFLGYPVEHEAANYVSKVLGVKFTDICQSHYTPLPLKILYKCERFLARLKKKHNFFKYLHVPILHFFAWALKKYTSWQYEVALNWNADAIIMDEALVQQGRSYLADTVLPEMVKKNHLKMYVIKTGHHVYSDFFPTGQTPPSYKPKGARYFIESGLIDELFAKKYFHQEKIIRLGNLRMDSLWIKELHQNILRPPYYNSDKWIKDLPTGKIKIVIMLAKMNYGVEAENLKNTIRQLSNFPDIALAIKPHTRGMKFDFMSLNEIEQAYIADSIPSALLCDWADMLLFTGSSIAFHAMIQNKAVGYMKYCQKLETIFDTYPGVTIYNSLDELLLQLNFHLNNNSLPGPKPEAQDLLKTHVYAARDDMETCVHYHRLISTDLKH